MREVAYKYIWIVMGWLEVDSPSIPRFSGEAFVLGRKLDHVTE